jgi:hypothetical protein
MLGFHMKTFAYCSLCLLIGIVAFIFGRMTVWPVAEMAAYWNEKGMSPTDAIDQIDSIKSHMEFGDQLAAVTSAQALRQIEENRIDAAKLILATNAAKFYLQYRSTPDPDSLRIIDLIERTRSISPSLKSAIEKEAEQGAAANP